MIFVVKPIEANSSCPTEGYLGYIHNLDISAHSGREVDLSTGLYNFRIGKLSGRKYKSWNAGVGLAWCALPHVYYSGYHLRKLINKGTDLESIISRDLKTNSMRWSTSFNCVLEPVSVTKEEDLWE